MSFSFVHHVLISLFVCTINGQHIDDWYSHFEYNTFVDNDDKFQVFWTPNQDSCVIEIGIAVETIGYAAFGVSESGGMAGSDIVMGWITDNDEVIIQNRYSQSHSTPVPFDNQNGIKIIDGWKEDIDGVYMTYLHFEKEMFADFDANNIDIKIGTTRIIYAWGQSQMAADSQPIKHCDTCKGVKSMNLLQGEGQEIALPDDSVYVDVNVNNYKIPSDDTTYYCSLQELPHYEQKQHVVRIDPVVDPIQNEGVVHHMLLYRCPESMVNKTDIGKGWICDEMEENMAPHQCRGGVVFAAWAIGANDFYFPENVGLEMSGTDIDAIQYVLLEMHYDNPTMDADIIDSSGLRLHYTPTLRELSASGITISMVPHPYGQFIPPGIQETTNLGYCFSECSSNGIPEEGVHAFSNLFHMHLLGRKQVLRHIRDGQELRPLDLNLAYDFDYQQYTPFAEEILIKPGDTFIVECTLDSSDVDYMTYGGQSSRNEMCMTFLYVYPKPKLSLCGSTFLWNDVNRFYQEAEVLGYYKNATFDPQRFMYIDGYYDVTVEGALDFYNDFQSGNLYHPAERRGYCFDNEDNPVQGHDATYDVIKSGQHYTEYDMDNYYQCQQSSSSSSFNWDTRYVYILAGLIGVLILILVYVIMKSKKKQYPSNTYKRVLGKYENDYGTTADEIENEISMQRAKMSTV